MVYSQLRSSHLLVAFAAALAVAVAVIWWWVYSGGLPLEVEVVTDAGVFTLAPPNPIPRTEAGGTACSDRLYVVGGIGARMQTFTSATAYDPLARTWTRLPDLPQPISHPGVVCVDGKLYVVGGFGPLGIRLRGFMFARWDPVDAVWIYDPDQGAWRKGPCMLAPRGAGGVAVVDGAVWYVGGIDANLEFAADLFRLALDSGTWERKAPMPTARDHLRMEALGDHLFAISGRRDDLRFNLANTERYDLRADAWETVADFSSPRGGLSSVVLDGKIYTFGGEHLWTCSDRIERYDPERDVWQTIGRLPEARHGIAAGVLRGNIHMVTGGRRPRISINGIHRVLDLRGTTS